MSNETKPDAKIEDILAIAKNSMAEIAQLVENAKTAVSGSTESQKTIATLLTDAQTKLSEIAAIATQVITTKTQITNDQAVVATKSDHIQKAQEHADSVRASLDRALTAATQQATDAEGQRNRAQSAADTANDLLTSIQTTKGSVDTSATAIETAKKMAEESSVLIKGLSDKSVTVEERIAAYEKRLQELDQQCADQLKTIESLLPGATSAGLAHAFDDRRKLFLNPRNRWQWIFVSSVLFIVLIAITGLWGLYHNAVGATPTYDDVIRMWLSRLPLAGALVWLALYASREAALAKRLEEDYGYKSAVAASFLGFHKQMAEIGATADGSPLAKLCGDTLSTISSPPGRIYDKHKLTVSPSDELATAAKSVVEVASVGKKSV
jgi:hypothetical protein